MCFHSPYAEFWHLYTFFKLSSISKEINFCLYVLCKAERVLGCCRELEAKAGFLWWKVTERSGCWGHQSTLFPVSMQGSLDQQQTQEEEMAFVEGNKLFFRPASCDLGLFAICMFGKKRKIRRRKQNVPGRMLFLALAGDRRRVSWIPSLLWFLGPRTLSLPLFPTLPSEPNKDVFSMSAVCRLMTVRGFFFLWWQQMDAQPSASRCSSFTFKTFVIALPFLHFGRCRC